MALITNNNRSVDWREEQQQKGKNNGRHAIQPWHACISVSVRCVNLQA